MDVNGKISPATKGYQLHDGFSAFWCVRTSGDHHGATESTVATWWMGKNSTVCYETWPSRSSWYTVIPMKNGDFPYLRKRLPEGRSYFVHWSNMHLVSWLFDCLCLFWDNSDESYPKLSPGSDENRNTTSTKWMFIQVYSERIGRVQLPFWWFLRKIARVHHISGLLGPPAAESWTPGPSETSKQSTALGAWAPSISGKIGYGLLLHYITFTTIETKPPFMLGIFHGELLNNQMVYLK